MVGTGDGDAKGDTGEVMDLTVELEGFEAAIINSCYTVNGVGRLMEYSGDQIRKWCNGEVVPREKTMNKIRGIVPVLEKKKAIQFHPSYGYATPGQIEQLKGYVTELERESIMKQIEKQTKLRGKID